MFCFVLAAPLFGPVKNRIPEYLRQLEQIKQNLDEASKASKSYAQFPRHACPSSPLDGTYPQFMLTACRRFEEVQRIDPTNLGE